MSTDTEINREGLGDAREACEDPAASLAELSYAQLAAALATSTATYNTIYRAFVAATEAVDLGIDVEENAAEMRGHLAACEAQAAMTAAIITEIGRRNG